MKLSEAILKGIEKFPRQSRYNYFSTHATPLGACAIGCVMYATAGEMTECSKDELIEIYPELGIETDAPEPDDCTDGRLIDVIIGLNYIWSREQIAAWLQEQGY